MEGGVPFQTRPHIKVGRDATEVDVLIIVEKENIKKIIWCCRIRENWKEAGILGKYN